MNSVHLQNKSIIKCPLWDKSVPHFSGENTAGLGGLELFVFISKISKKKTAIDVEGRKKGKKRGVKGKWQSSKVCKRVYF